MILSGILGFLVVDDVVHSVASTIQFTEPWKPFEALFQTLIFERGSRAVWLWTLLPAQIAWLYVGSIVKRIENLR